MVRWTFVTVGVALAALASSACSSEDAASGSSPDSSAGGNAGALGASGGTSSISSGGANAGTAGTAGGPSGGTTGFSGASNGGDAASASGGNGGSSGGAATGGATATGDGGPPPGFWDTGPIPAAKNVMMFRFLNRTNGKYADSEVYWSFKNGGISETHSIADEDTYDMPANASGRMYFYLCHTGDATCAADPTKSPYFDFIEHTIGATQYNGNTTRVDAFGLKIAMRLHCADGFDRAVGEDYATFQEDRAVTFQKFIDSVPDEFKPLAEPPHAPYRIVQPGAAGFGNGGPYQHYYDSFVDEIWSQNGITVPKPGPNGSGLAAYPNLSAAIFRHVGNKPNTFDANGKLLDGALWSDSSTFYRAAPANYYARFWHDHALGGKAYGFPYDDVGGYSSYVSHSNPEYMLVAIGW